MRSSGEMLMALMEPPTSTLAMVAAVQRRTLRGEGDLRKSSG
jgi:hypothetical protein